MSKKTHYFQQSLIRGKMGEAKLDKWLRQKYKVRPASLEEELEFGFDRHVTRPDGSQFTVEYKMDERAHETGNVFIETQVGDGLGWARKSQADLVLYFMPGLEKLLVLEPEILRQHLPEWTRQHRQLEVHNDRFMGYGLGVPVDVVEEMATHIIRMV